MQLLLGRRYPQIFCTPPPPYNLINLLSNLITINLLKSTEIVAEYIFNN